MDAQVVEAVDQALPAVLQAGIRLGISPDESEQELALAAWRAIQRGFEPDRATLASYARRCAINSMTDQAKARARRAEREVTVRDSSGRLVPLVELVESEARSALVELIEREEWELAMAALTDTQRRRAELVMAGFTIGEIALLEDAGRL